MRVNMPGGPSRWAGHSARLSCSARLLLTEWACRRLWWQDEPDETRDERSVIAGFRGEDAADQVFNKLAALQKEHLNDLEDASVVRDPAGQACPE
jgi:hypothetical protein